MGVERCPLCDGYGRHRAGCDIGEHQAKVNRDGIGRARAAIKAGVMVREAPAPPPPGDRPHRRRLPPAAEPPAEDTSAA